VVGAGGAGAVVLSRSLDIFQKKIVMAGGGDREEEGVDGEGSADELRMKRRLDMLKKIDAKVESKGLSSLSANEFQMMHEELQDMVKYGDEAVFQMSEEDVQTKTLERRKAREVGILIFIPACIFMHACYMHLYMRTYACMYRKPIQIKQTSVEAHVFQGVK
jgi:hypothetical protein